MNHFFELSLHQKINFIDDVVKRVETILPKAQYQYLGVDKASNQELILNCIFCKALYYIHEHLEESSLTLIYRKLNPRRVIRFPEQFRDQSFVISIVAKLFSTYQNSLPTSKVLDLIITCLTNLGALSPKEAQALSSIIEFHPKQKSLTLKFHDQKYHIHLNSRSRLGYELTILRT
ncbi:MAG: hypothetical protein KC646_12850 [Candidatus Cloacimonetes bacterium]|nr:hypothetical protein [Candidatus Cloacimonadota bacterium]